MSTAVEQFPQTSWWLVANGNSLTLGSYEIPQDCDLNHAEVRIYNKNAAAYSYTLRLVVSASLNGPALVTSDPLVFNNANTGQIGSDWIGVAVFDFAQYSLKALETYYFRLSLTGYSRPARPNENTQYLAAGCDWLNPVGSANTGAGRIAMAVK